MTAFLKQAPAGFAGDISRTDESNVEPAMLVGVGGTVFPSALGIPMKYVAGGIQQFNGGAETAADFAGVLVREVPGISGSSADDALLEPTAPYSKQVQGLLVRGYAIVKCAAGTPARGGLVYIQIVANGGVTVGSFRATADGGNTIVLTAQQAQFASDGVDAFGNAEIRVQR